MTTPIVRRPALSALAFVFARSGNSTFGGGTATIIELERTLVDEQQWLRSSDSHLAYAISRLTPGTNLLAYCVAVGWRIRGAAGALVALGAASLPCAVIATALTAFFATWSRHPLTAPAMKGALAAAIAIMIGTVWTMIRRGTSRGRTIGMLLLAGAAFWCSAGPGLSPVPVLVAAALVGLVWPDAPSPS